MSGKRWQRLIGDDILGGIYPAMNAMSDNELRTVRSAPRKMTASNCWWVTYQCAPMLADIADHILQNRYAQRRKDRRAMK